MALNTHRQHSMQPPRLLSWSMSLAVHAGVLTGLVYVLPMWKSQIALETQDETVNIVLQSRADPVEETEDSWEIDDSPITPPVAEAKPLKIEQTDEKPNKATLEIVTPTTATPSPNSSPKAPTADSTSQEDLGLGQARLNVFGNQAVGVKYVFLFDRSVSMEGPPLEAAKSQLITNLRTLEDNHEFQIVFFNHEPEIWQDSGRIPQLAEATAQNRSLAESFIESIQAEGGTYRRAALQQALLMKPDVIYFLTDADAAMSGNDILQAIKAARRNKTAIHSIEFGGVPHPKQENFLKQLARYTQGKYVYINTNTLSLPSAN